tara:strand:+ start:114 stop:797 length:684 start_codon:yes stop_codon:yes gene_type:complete
MCPLIFFELIPTKLPHYLYPSYLPLSILISKTIIENDFSKDVLKYSAFPLIIFPIAIIGLFIFSTAQFSEFDLGFLITIIILTSFTVILFWLKIKRRVKSLIISCGCFQVISYMFLIFFLIPRLDKIWISERINEIITTHETSVQKIYTIGFNEPSLLFLTSHKSSNSITHFKSHTIEEEKILLVITDEANKDITENIDLSSFNLVEEFMGFNYSRGKNVGFRVYKN